ncbi:protein C10 [Anthonomus grandis grandis]|uniref:protein C10 n=1 Tax=Anthonomus grandis grandis TaxID=2921223 RepID=UPI002165DCB4|nr:protein C10 [Anthonomus grandis grandis]
MSRQDMIPSLTPELAIEILNKTLDYLQKPENHQKIEEARDNVGNEMLKMMQYIFPIVMEIQIEVIKLYGFPETREGIIKFTQMVRNLEREDSEVARLHDLIKRYYLPPVPANTNSESGEERTSST